tara:strand:+ start:127 stop:540 length:414 start_codon:yes stop_codon:yes gene_type:complete
MEDGETDDTTLSETGTTLIQLIKDLKYDIQREHLTLMHIQEPDLVRYINIDTSRHQRYHQKKPISNQGPLFNKQTQDQDQTQESPMNKQNQPKTQLLNILEETSLHKDYELHTEHLLIMNEQEFEIPNHVNNDHAKI